MWHAYYFGHLRPRFACQAWEWEFLSIMFIGRTLYDFWMMFDILFTVLDILHLVCILLFFRAGLSHKKDVCIFNNF